MIITGPLWDILGQYFGNVPVSCRWQTDPDGCSDELTMVLGIKTDVSSAAFRKARKKVHVAIREHMPKLIWMMTAIVRD